MFRTALRFSLGAAAAIALWIWVTPVYNAVLASIAGPVIRIDPRLRHAEVLGSGRGILARGGAGQPHLPAVLIPADQLTYNVILLAGLFATNAAPLRDRGFVRIAAALLALFVTHVLMIAVAVEATYATRTGAWGAGAYGPLEQDFWSALEYGYRLAGMFAVAFGCWWVSRVSGPSEGRTGRARSAG